MKCLYCGSTKTVHTDHMVPRSRGGLRIEGNLFPACKSCNSSKGNRLPSEWRDDLPSEVYELEKAALKLHPEIPSRNIKPIKACNINIRCTEQQKNILESIAIHEGMCVSTWLLQQGLRAERVERDRRAEREARR